MSLVIVFNEKNKLTLQHKEIEMKNEKIVFGEQ